jgi:glycosyltransferase involved in cell wall biosynthesis
VVAAFVAKLRGAILVNWVQDVFPEVASALGVKGFTPAVNHFLVRLRNKSWCIAKANVVLGQKMADYLVDAGVGNNSIHIINNWVDDDKLEPIKKEDNRLRHEWGLSDKFVVGYSGNMGRAHEFSTILQIASAFQDDPQVVFLFIGGGAQRGAIEADANKYGLNNILFQPYQDTELLPISLSVPDLHLISLKPELEGFIVPSKFYGIAAVARPVLYIGDDKGEIPMILKDNGGGITISIGDASGGVMYIKKLIRDNEYRIRLGMQMKDMAEKQFSKSKALKAWHDVFTDIVN